MSLVTCHADKLKRACSGTSTPSRSATPRVHLRVDAQCLGQGDEQIRCTRLRGVLTFVWSWLVTDEQADEIKRALAGGRRGKPVLIKWLEQLLEDRAHWIRIARVRLNSRMGLSISLRQARFVQMCAGHASLSEPHANATVDYPPIQRRPSVDGPTAVDRGHRTKQGIPVGLSYVPQVFSV